AQPLSQLSILTSAESDLILNEWTRTEKKYPSEKTLIQLLEEQSAQTPNATALVCGTRRLTYQELCLRSRLVARQLQAFGVGANGRVGICLERSEDMVAGILGTLQAGGAYVPLDPAYPKARLEFIASDAGMTVLLTRRKFSGLFATENTPLLCIEDLAVERDEQINGGASASDLAYVLYTSGSTGQPKGVALENRSVVAFISWARDVFTREEISGVLASTSICFDLSVFELFVPLCCGGKVILAENALALPALPAASEVTLINTVPSAIRELLRVNGVPPSVRVVNLAGEPLQAAVVDQIYSETSANKVYDLYGPTETTTYSTFTLRKSGESATIGRPLANEQVYILDKQMRPMPVGIPGDLYIGGAGLARGYLNRPELTAERFLTNPYRPGQRFYKTGDVARWREDGNLVYLGRSDHQVKIRGFRIELGEIESALKKISSVGEAIVVVREDRPGDKRLAAYVVLRPGQQATADELRGCVAQRLPQYMVPAHIVFLPQLPMTPNGKVDRQALPAPKSEEGLRRDFEPPSEGLESQIAEIWAEVLGLEKVGATENFLQLGGHSLMAVQVTSRLRATLDFDLPLTCLFEAPTVRELAVGINSGRWQSNAAPIPDLKPCSRGNVSPASFMQEQLWVLHQLDKTSDAYNVPVAVQIKGPLDLTALQSSLDAIVRRHEALRTTLRISDGVLVQSVHPSLEIKIAFKNFCGGSESGAREFLRDELQRPFDLESGPLLRATLAQTGETDYALLIVMHHAITDGWSLDILFRELGGNYRAFVEKGSAQNESALEVQFADYAQWQRAWMQGERLDRELTYWKEKLALAPAEVNLPTDFPASENAVKKVGHSKIDLPKQLCRNLAQIGKSEGATTFTVLIAALAITLRKWSGQTDLVLGTVVAGRNRREIESLIGCIMNFLPLRFNIAGTESNLEVLRAVKAEVIDGQTHQDCPFGKIVESLSVQRSAHRNPVYNVALLYQNAPEMPRFGKALECRPIELESSSALLDMRFEANETETGMSFKCEYNAGLFDGKTIRHLLSAIQMELENLARSPNAKILDSTLDGVLAEQARLARARTHLETIVISSTFTAEPVEGALRYWLNELEIASDIKFAPYNQVFQQLLNGASELAANKRGLNVLLIRLQDWKSSSARQEFARAIQAPIARGGAPILVCFCPPSRIIAGDKTKVRELQKIEIALQAELAAC
ncbi:MAG TPA: amino acid adenylation domain-containing protein, partial [Verrucomicrobiae bacterium]|nr:amino acid adenylation domain-containing protein [Verrucomicrobiae bacterium]